MGVNATFQYYQFEAAAVTAPLLGPETGGTTVQVRGPPLVSSHTPLCRFGSSNISSGQREDSGSVSCTSPEYWGLPLTDCEGNSSTKLELSLNGQQYLSLGQFIYYSRDAPCLESVDPISGPVDGGTDVAISLTLSTPLRAHLRKFLSLFREKQNQRARAASLSIMYRSF